MATLPKNPRCMACASRSAQPVLSCSSLAWLPEVVFSEVVQLVCMLGSLAAGVSTRKKIMYRILITSNGLDAGTWRRAEKPGGFAEGLTERSNTRVPDLPPRCEIPPRGSDQLADRRVL